MEHRLTCQSKREILLQTFLEAPCYPHTWSKPLSRTPKNLSNFKIHMNDKWGIAPFTGPSLFQCWKKTRAADPWNFPGPVWKLPGIGQPERFNEYSVSHLIIVDISQKYFLVSFLLFCCYLEINHCANLSELRCINFESHITIMNQASLWIGLFCQGVAQLS